MKILLVDDEPGIREGLAALLRMKGHEVRPAEDLASARQSLECEEFDVVVTDWRLPDGTADSLLALIDVPIVAVSGNPEQVAESTQIAEVLAKPVLPVKLLQVLEELMQAKAAARVSPFEELPIDVRIVLDRALDLLGPQDVRVVDDGVMVTLSAQWPGDPMRPRFEELGGDLRVLVREGGPQLEHRWCRDGRPDPSLPKIRANESWPLVDQLCVDFHDTACGLEDFERCVDRACAWRSDGRRVHFLNVPRDLIAAMESSGRAADLPMKERIGPRIPATLQDLWS